MVQTRSQTTHTTKSTKKVNPNIYKNTKAKKSTKKIVKFEEDKSCITHIHENHRIVTIAFFYHPINHTLRYGGTVFKKEPGHTWNRKNHVHTARERFNNCPVELVNFEPDKGEFREYMRKQLFSFGVHGNRI